MAWKEIIWDQTAGGNVEHVEEHDLTTALIGNPSMRARTMTVLWSGLR